MCGYASAEGVEIEGSKSIVSNVQSSFTFRGFAHSQGRPKNGNT
jgi:hypothetical protein